MKKAEICKPTGWGHHPQIWRNIANDEPRLVFHGIESPVYNSGVGTVFQTIRDFIELNRNENTH